MYRLGCACLLVLAWMGTVHAGANTFEDLVAKVKPSIVAIGTLQKTRSPQFLFRGTGFAVSDGHLIVTNAHVLPGTMDQDRLESLEVVVPARDDVAEEQRDAAVVAVDREHDLAVLRIGGAALPTLSLAQHDRYRDGQSAAFTGFPIGAVLGLVPVTHRATISALTPIALAAANARQLDVNTFRRLQTGVFTVLQLDATAYPGNSGSPLYDASTGEVLGVVNMVFVKSTKEAVLAQPSGISFAVPAAHVRTLVTAVEKEGYNRLR